MHYGRASLSELSRLPAYFVFPRRELDVEDAAARITAAATAAAGTTAAAALVLLDQPYAHLLPALRGALASGSSVVNSSPASGSSVGNPSRVSGSSTVKPSPAAQGERQTPDAKDGASDQWQGVGRSPNSATSPTQSDERSTAFSGSSSCSPAPVPVIFAEVRAGPRDPVQPSNRGPVPACNGGAAAAGSRQGSGCCQTTTAPVAGCCQAGSPAPPQPARGEGTKPSGGPSAEPITEPSTQHSTQHSKHHSTQRSRELSTVPSTQHSTQSSGGPSTQPNTELSMQHSTHSSGGPSTQHSTEPLANGGTAAVAAAAGAPQPPPGVAACLPESSTTAEAPAGSGSVGGRPFSVAGLSWVLSSEVEMSEVALLWVGDPQSTSLAQLQLTYNSARWTVFDPATGDTQEVRCNGNGN